MIIVYAGSQPDAEDRATPRFPRTAEDQVATRIRGLLQDLKPSLAIGALAAGSDILFAETARLEGVTLRPVLPFNVDTFRETSVSPAGARWEERYDRLTSEVDVVTGDLELTNSSYTDHNAFVLDDAARIAEETGEEIWCILVRPSPADGEAASSVTDDMADRAAQRGLLVLDIDPLVERKRAFVVMPFGKKYDPVLRRYIDCDPVFHRIYRPLLEDLDLDWNRADLSVDSGIIHVGMIDDLANSDVVLADLTTTNFNVAYEIGVRHVFARRSTVLVSPKVSGLKSSGPPFDIALIRAHSFERDLILSDIQAQNAIRRLRPILQAAIDGSLHTDSPIHEWFSVDGIIPPFSRRSDVKVDEEIEIRKQVRTAIKSAAPEPMMTAADVLITANISEQVRLALRIELAVGLLEEAKYEAALHLLEVAEPLSDHPLHRVWLHKSVLALRRIGEKSPEISERKLNLDRAAELLRLAIELGYEDSESYGIWGGLLKRQLMRGDVTGLAATATFRQMTAYYEKGFRADPQAYTGVNFAMALRVQGNRQNLSESERDKLAEALVVSRFLNGISLDHDATDPWALITDAELQLHAALVQKKETQQAALAYASASLVASDEVIGSALDQLRFMELWGDPPEVIDPIIDVLTQKRASQ